MQSTSYLDAALPLVIALTLGVAAALLAWLISRALAAVPREDRAYKDPPPVGFRFVWWPIQWISHYFQRAPGTKAIERTMVKLREAGLDYSLSPAQFRASRLVAGAVCGLLAWWIVDSIAGMRGRGAPGLVVLLEAMAIGWLAGSFYPVIWLHERLARRRRELMKTLPFFLDIITLCVEAGLNLQGAMGQAVANGPRGVMRDEFQRVLRDIRAGKARAASLRAMADRLNQSGINSFCSTVIQAESMGMSLGPVLRTQADQRRVERFLRAEKLAMQAPVKMLFPLLAFIFPCTFIVLLFPLAMKFVQAGF
ncbi:MAG: secretion system protein [Herminiimonas sp.]|nr:secretion system protein [Herminiimonas sp.]